LKLAISQNLQESFTREFEATLSQLGAQQIHYVRKQTITRLAVTTISGLVGAVAMALSIIFFDTSASVLITLLLIFSRMSGPVMQLQLDAQHLARTLPAYEKIRELENDLAVAEATTVAYPNHARVVPDGPIVFRGSRSRTMRTRVYPTQPEVCAISIWSSSPEASLVSPGHRVPERDVCRPSRWSLFAAVRRNLRRRRSITRTISDGVAKRG